MKKAAKLLIGLALCGGMIVTLYMTCITEVKKTWLDLDAGDSFNHTTEALYEGNVYDQYFIAQRSIVEQLRFRAVTWNREYGPDDVLSVSVICAETKEVVAECDISLQDLEDNRMAELPLQGIRLIKGDWYILRFEGHATEEPHSISIMLSDKGDSGWEYCKYNGELQEYNLAVSIEGRGMF